MILTFSATVVHELDEYWVKVPSAELTYRAPSTVASTVAPTETSDALSVTASTSMAVLSKLKAIWLHGFLMINQ